MPFVVGETVGPYRILEQHGQGGMATVFKAYHASLDRYVAIKALHPAFKEDPNFLARFQREARVIAKLEHPNIVPVYDFAEHEGRPYLVMKFIEGETLKTRLQRGNLSAAEIVRIVEATGAALIYAHRQGILHRDVKPSNVLLAKDGQIYLADFGLARIAAAGESTLSSDMLVGTPQYISPEQALGKKELDAGTDIYSLGVMIYEMIVGRVPFSADTPYAIIHDHIYTPLPRQINPNIPEVVERVLLKALAKDRADRFADVETLVDAFKYAVEVSGMLPPPVVAEKTWAAVTRPAADLGDADLDEVSPSLVSSMATRPSAASGEISPSGLSPIATRPASDALPLPARAAQPAFASTPRPLNVVQQASKPRRSLWWLGLLIPLILLGLCACGWIVAARMSSVGRDPVQRALQVAKANPDDPYAQLDLALAYADHQQPDAARQQFDKALALGGNDVEFFAHAGEEMASRGAWLYAAKAYILMVRNYPTPLPDERRNAWHEAVYRAYRQPEAGEMFPIPEIRERDEPMAVIAQVEVELIAGRLVAAKTILEGAVRLRGEFPEARLLEAEILLRSQMPEKARPILESLTGDDQLPAWIRDEAQRMLEQIP